MFCIAMVLCLPCIAGYWPLMNTPTLHPFVNDNLLCTLLGAHVYIYIYCRLHYNGVASFYCKFIVICVAMGILLALNMGVLALHHNTSSPRLSFPPPTAQKATIHQVTTLLAISKNVLFPGHNHLLTTSTDDSTL